MSIRPKVPLSQQDVSPQTPCGITPTHPPEENAAVWARRGILPVHASLSQALLDWFALNMRSLPWRKTYAPYQVWISEVMLQQTQMERVVQYFSRWIQRFPDVRELDGADEEEVLKLWEGLGYYRRARDLHKAAHVIMHRHNGVLPLDYDALRALPGIGDYTAGAILSIAANLAIPAVDANVERVFARLFDIDAPVKSPIAADYIRHMATSLIPPGKAREFNQALMELGALVCGKKPRCACCPLAACCQARRLDITAERPVPGKKYTYTALAVISGVLVYKGRVFIQKRLDSGVWAGLWEFPGGRLEEGEEPAQGIVREFLEETEFSIKVIKSLGLVRHAYTRYKIAMHCFLCDFAELPAKCDANGLPEPVLHAATDYRWVHPAELEQYALPAGHRKLLDKWLPEIMKASGA